MNSFFLWAALARISLVLFLLLPVGCMDTIWEHYKRPNYGPSRAMRICHPYGNCSQGRWVSTAQVKDDVRQAYLACRHQLWQSTNGWSESSVSVGLEVRHCMRSKGYALGKVNHKVGIFENFTDKRRNPPDFLEESPPCAFC